MQSQVSPKVSRHLHKRGSNMKKRLICLTLALGTLGLSISCLYPDYDRRRERGPYDRREQGPEHRRDRDDRDRDDRHADGHQPAPGLVH
jgi:hypothetical protein